MKLILYHQFLATPPLLVRSAAAQTRSRRLAAGRPSGARAVSSLVRSVSARQGSHNSRKAAGLAGAGLPLLPPSPLGTLPPGTRTTKGLGNHLEDDKRPWQAEDVGRGEGKVG